MGRTLAALLVLGLLAAGGWYLVGRSGGPGPGPGPGAGDGAAVTSGEPAGAGPAGAGRFAGDGPPLPASAFSAGAVPPGPSSTPVPPATSAAPAPTTASAADVRRLLQTGNAREAVARALELAPESLRDPGCAAVAMDAAQALASGPSSGPDDRMLRADSARRLFGRLVVADAVPMAQVQDRLEKLNREVLVGRREVPGVVFKGAVKPGDTLDRLMKREWKGRVHSGFGAVLWMNNIGGPDRLRTGPIWVPEEPVRIVVHKRSHQLWVLLGEVPVRQFPVGLGMNGRTPEGMFQIEELMPRPDYWPPGGKRVPFGQKGNPLGTRWMGFRDTAEAQGIGIHGTDEPQSIGKDESQGCVRMRNEDVEQVFTWATVGTPVEVRP